MDTSGRLAHFLCDAADALVDAFVFDDADREAAQAGDVFWAMAGADAAAVFIVVPIEDVMTAILDAPVAAVSGQHALGVGLVRGLAGDAVGDILSVFAALFVGKKGVR